MATDESGATKEVVEDDDESTKTLAIVKKGKDCIAKAETIYSDLMKGCVEGVEQKLKDLEGVAEELVKHAGDRIKEAEEVEKQCEQKSKEIHMKKGELELQKEKLEQRKPGLEATLRAKQQFEEQASSDLSSAESRLSDAELYEVRRVKRRKNKRVGGGALLGAFIGTLLAPGVGTALGAAAGAGTGLAVDSAVKESRDRVGDRKRRRDDAQAEVSSAKRAVSSIERQILEVTSQCQELEHKCEQYNEKAKKVKEALKFFLEALQYWKKFQNISKHAANCTAQLQRIISKAKDQEEWLDGMVGKSFLDAWVMIETKCMQGVNFFLRLNSKHLKAVDLSI